MHLIVVYGQIDIASKDKLETTLQEVSMAKKTLIIAVLNKAYTEENGMLDLFLQSLREGEDTKFLIRHLLLVAVDKTAFNRCKLLKLHCYRLVIKRTDFSREQLYMSDGFTKMMWQRIAFLRDVHFSVLSGYGCHVAAKSIHKTEPQWR